MREDVVRPFFCPLDCGRSVQAVVPRETKLTVDQIVEASNTLYELLCARIRGLPATHAIMQGKLREEESLRRAPPFLVIAPATAGIAKVSVITATTRTLQFSFEAGLQLEARCPLQIAKRARKCLAGSDVLFAPIPDISSFQRK